MSGIELKVTRHEKKQKNKNSNEDEKQSTEIEPEITNMGELDKNIKYVL